MTHTLYVTTSFDTKKIKECFDIDRTTCYDNSPSHEDKERMLAFEGSLFDLVDGGRRISRLSDHKITWALILGGARPMVISTNGSHIGEDLEASKYDSEFYKNRRKRVAELEELNRTFPTLPSSTEEASRMIKEHKETMSYIRDSKNSFKNI